MLRRMETWLPRGVLRLAASLLGETRGAPVRALTTAGWSDYLKARAANMTRVWSGEQKSALVGTGTDDADTDHLIRSWHDLSTSRHPLDRLQTAYCHSWLVEDLLMKADKMSMANSLELRVPFLDHKLVEWAACLPMEWKVGGKNSGWSSKRILRAFAAKRIPQRIISRPKQGFPVPAYRWLANGLTGWAEDRIAGGGRLADYMDVTPARNVLAAASQGDRLAAHKIWTLLILDHWLEAWT
jgi:asparagine synthase (glutamine-hydrolysing)